MHKTEQDFDREQKLDERIRSQMQKKSRLPDEVQRAKERAFAAIEKQQGPGSGDGEQKTQSQRKTTQADTETVETTDTKEREKISKITKPVWEKWLGGVAAAVVAFSCICIANPVLAENIPIIGHVFEMISNNIQFGGDFSSYAEPVKLESTADIENETKQRVSTLMEETKDDTQASLTVGDAMITLDEAYCNGKYLYISMVLKSKEKLVENMDTAGTAVVSLMGEMRFSYAQGWDILQDEIDGKLLDEYTYVGMFRHNMADSLLDFQNEQRKENGETMEVPDNFTVRMYMGAVDATFSGNKVYKALTFNRPWEFKLDVSVNRENITEYVVNKEEKEDFKAITLVKTPFEIVAEWELDRASLRNGEDYDIILLDADGVPLPIGQSPDDFSIEGHDISAITAYVVTDDEFFDGIKSYTYGGRNLSEDMPGMDLKQLLEQKSIYSEKVTFE